MSEPVPVRAKDCICPGTPHERGDFVYLAPKLTATAGAAATNAMQRAKLTIDDMVGALGGVFMANCIVGWDFVREATDDKGKVYIEAVPVDRETIDEYLPWAEGGQPVISKIDELYTEDFLRPLGLRPPKSSPDGQTEPSTYPIPLSGHKPRKRSKRSLQNGSAGSSYAARA